MQRMVHENCMINLNNIEKAYEALLQSKQLIPEEVVEFVLTTLVEDLATFTPSNCKFQTIYRLEFHFC